MFGIKRPLRFLIRKLELDEEQVMVVMDAMSDFRIERDQAGIEARRARKVLVSALTGDEFDREKAAEAVEQQVESHRRLREAFVDALERVHGILNAAQREKLSFLLGSLDFEI